MQIEYLADRPEFIPLLAQWHYNEWWHLHPGESLEARTNRLRNTARHRQIPSTFVAVANGCLLGSASLVAHDMDTRMDLTPWLAGVYVHPDYRGQGIGAALVQRVMREAKLLAVRILYLYTPSAEGFYQRLGWTTLERATYQNTEVVIMAYSVIEGSW